MMKKGIQKRVLQVKHETHSRSKSLVWILKNEWIVKSFYFTGKSDWTAQTLSPVTSSWHTSVQNSGLFLWFQREAVVFCYPTTLFSVDHSWQWLLWEFIKFVALKQHYVHFCAVWRPPTLQVVFTGVSNIHRSLNTTWNLRSSYLLFNSDESSYVSVCSLLFYRNCPQQPHSSVLLLPLFFHQRPLNSICSSVMKWEGLQLAAYMLLSGTSVNHSWGRAVIGHQRENRRTFSP